MPTGQYAVMAAITMDAAAVQSWLNQNPPISILITAAPSAEGGVTATVRLIPPGFGDLSQLPADPNSPPTGSTPPDADAGGSLPSPDPSAPSYQPPSANGGGGMFCIIATGEPPGLVDRAKAKLKDVANGVTNGINELSEEARNWLRNKLNKIAQALSHMQGEGITVTVTLPIPGGGSITISRTGTGAQAGEFLEGLTGALLY
jgi:hypothetical protein